MIINHDYTNFDPSGFSLPPVGRFLQRVVDDKMNTKSTEKGGYAFFTVTFQIEEGENKGQKYNLDYNTGHPNVQTREIAMKSLGLLYYGVTGEKPPVRGFDTAILQRAPFYGVISIKESPKNDGTDGVYRNVNLNNIEPVNAAAPTNAAPAQQYQAQPAQAAVNAAPASSAPWAANQ